MIKKFRSAEEVFAALPSLIVFLPVLMQEGGGFNLSPSSFTTIFVDKPRGDLLFDSTTSLKEKYYITVENNCSLR